MNGEFFHENFIKEKNFDYRLAIKRTRKGNFSFFVKLSSQKISPKRIKLKQFFCSYQFKPQRYFLISFSCYMIYFYFPY